MVKTTLRPWLDDKFVEVQSTKEFTKQEKREISIGIRQARIDCDINRSGPSVDEIKSAINSINPNFDLDKIIDIIF